MGVTLGELVTRLRLEAGFSSSAATGLNQRDQLVYLINRAQEELLMQYDWPSLTVDRDVPLVVGTRYYAYPADLPFDNITNAWLLYQTVYDQLAYGIGPEQFILYESSTGFRSWPVQRWMHHADNGLFEVWPVPSEAPVATSTTPAAGIRFRGTKQVPFMVADSDQCTLNETVIVLYAAAELLAREQSKDAELKINKARAYLQRMRARQAKTGSIIMGGGGGRRGPRPGFDYIPSRYGHGPG